MTVLGAWSILSPVSVSACIPVRIKDVCVYLLMTKPGGWRGASDMQKERNRQFVSFILDFISPHEDMHMIIQK